MGFKREQNGNNPQLDIQDVNKKHSIEVVLLLVGHSFMYNKDITEKIIYEKFGLKENN